MSDNVQTLLTALRTGDGLRLLESAGLTYSQVADELDVPLEAPTTVSALQLATIDDIFAELGKRCKAVLLVCEEPRHNSTRTQTQYIGGLVSALGLAQYATNELRHTQRLYTEHDECDDLVDVVDEDEDD